MFYRIFIFILLLATSLQSHSQILFSGGFGSQYGLLGIRGAMETKIVNVAACVGTGFVCAGLEKEFGEKQNYSLGVSAGATAFILYQSTHFNYYFNGYGNNNSWIAGLEVGQIATGSLLDKSSFVTFSIGRRFSYF